RIDNVTHLYHTHRGADFHQRRDAQRVAGRTDNRVGVRVLEYHTARERIRKSRGIRERSIGRKVRPDVVVPGIGLPQAGGVAHVELLDAPVAPFKRDGTGTPRRGRIDWAVERLA